MATVFSQAELNAILTNLPGWILKKQEPSVLTKTFTFKDFNQALRFVNIIAWYAENKQHHHPDIVINYNKVTFELCTHDAKAITDKDIALAQIIEKKAHESFTNDLAVTVAQVRDQVEKFTTDRDWTKHHSLKNVATNLIVEAGELLEHFTWLERSDEESLESKRNAIEDEIVDIVFSALLFANRFNTNFAQAFERKMEQNAKKYPIDKVKGKKEKYTEYEK